MSHVKTSTTYPKSSPCPSDAWFTRHGKSMNGGNPSRTNYDGDSTTPNGGHHSSTDKVRVTQAEGGHGGASPDTYPKRMHETFKNEKVS